MKKLKISLLVFCIVILLSIIAFAANSNIPDALQNFSLATYDIKVEYDVRNFSHPVYVQNGITYAALRDICWELGYYANWEGTDWAVNIMPYRSKQINVSPTTVLKEEGVIPNAETALAIGKLLLEEYAGKELEFETDSMKYTLFPVYLDDESAWLVMQNVKPKKSAGGGSDYRYRPHIKLSKNTGEVLYIHIK